LVAGSGQTAFDGSSWKSRHLPFAKPIVESNPEQAVSDPKPEDATPPLERVVMTHTGMRGV
jgi:hypothetical protein